LRRKGRLTEEQAFNLVAQYDSRSAVQISTNTATDSAAMKTISVLGLVFLPGTFICVCPSLPFYSLNEAKTKKVIILHHIFQLHTRLGQLSPTMGDIRKILGLLRSRGPHHVDHYRVLVLVDECVDEEGG
jgi:hypothetical protein